VAQLCRRANFSQVLVLRCIYFEYSQKTILRWSSNFVVTRLELPPQTKVVCHSSTDGCDLYSSAAGHLGNHSPCICRGLADENGRSRWMASVLRNAMKSVLCWNQFQSGSFPLKSTQSKLCICLCSQANLVSLNYWDLPPNVKMKTWNAFRYCDELLNTFHGCPNMGRAPSLFMILAARCLMCYQNYVFCPCYWKLSGILFHASKYCKYLGSTEAIIP
jgi:hypothetical protein